MSVASKKITIYSSPQLSTHAFVSPKVDVNQNTKFFGASANLLRAGSNPNFNSNLNSKSLQDSTGNVIAPQRTTLRLRVSDPKELEMLQLAASRGCATLGGRQVRIVSVQKSHTSSIPVSSTCSNLQFEDTAIVTSSVNYAYRTAGGVCISDSNRTLSSSPMLQSRSHTVSQSSTASDVCQTLCAASTQLHVNSSTQLHVDSSSQLHVNASLFGPSCVPAVQQVMSRCEAPSSRTDLRAESRVAVCGTSLITTAKTTANTDLNTINSSMCNGFITSCKQTVAAETPCSSSSGLSRSNCEGIRHNLSSTDCLAIKQNMPTAFRTNVLASDSFTCTSTDSEKLVDMGPESLPQHSSVTIRTMASQGAKYLGSFAVNSSTVDNKRGEISNDKNSPTGSNSQKVVLRISSKNNAVDVKSLMSSERLPMLVKAIEKVLSANGIKSSAAKVCPPFDVKSEHQCSENKQNLLSHGSKPTYRPNFHKTVGNNNKRQCALIDGKSSTKKAKCSQNFTDQYKLFNHLGSHKDINSQEYLINNSLLMGVLADNSNLSTSLKSAGTSNRPTQCLTSKRPTSGKNNAKGRTVYSDGCQSVRINDPRYPSYNWWCARQRPFATRKRRGIFSFLMSKYRKKLTFTSSSSKSFESAVVACGLPVAERFRYVRHMVKGTVAVHKSSIQGLGLFARRHIDEGEMIVEYAGEVIRATVADIRERRYEAQGIGCYMFRHGEDDVVDATRSGNVARFINHSCEPNCFSREVKIEGRRHIIIFALRSIYRGEELTYDYKFPIEDVKMPCLCGARRCRKYLN